MANMSDTEPLLIDTDDNVDHAAAPSIENGNIIYFYLIYSSLFVDWSKFPTYKLKHTVICKIVLASALNFFFLNLAISLVTVSYTHLTLPTIYSV